MDWVALARTLATEAHAGQMDKAGQPYIVMWHGWRLRCAATMTPKWWRGCMMWPRTARRLPHASRHSPPRCARRCTCSSAPRPRRGQLLRAHCRPPLALKVKRADLDDNADPQRLAMLDAATAGRLRGKYAHARAALGI